MSDLQNLTIYEPTEKEKNLLEVLLNPENRMKSISDICKLANCSRPIYYEAFAKSGFNELYKSKAQELIKQSVVPVVNTFVREAQRGSFQHGKVILEMAGLYTEKTDNTIRNPEGESFKVDSVADADKIIADYLAKQNTKE